MTLSLHEVGISDIEALRLDLLADCVAELNQLGMPFDWVVEQGLARSAEARSIKRADGVLVGIVGINLRDDGAYEPWMLLTNAVEGHRLSLCKLLKKELRRFGGVSMRQTIPVDNVRGARLFSLLGFELEETGSGYSCKKVGT